MALNVTCPHCSAQFETPDSFAGKMGKCPMCGQAFRAPSAAGSGSISSAPKASPLKRATAITDDPAPAAKSPQRKPSPVEAEVADDGFSPIVSTSPLSTPAAPSKPVIKPPSPPASIPIWGWIGGGVALVALLGIGVYFITTLGNNPPAIGTVPRKPGVLDKEGGKGPLLTADWGKARKVKSLEDATAAMVKIIVPTKRGIGTGSGFIINDRGWIATNHHVIAGANANSRLEMSDGTIYEMAPGVIVDSPELDMAIIKFKEPPFQLTVFELQPTPDPKLGSPVFCYGHPRGVSFSVVDGVVGKVVATKNLDDASQNWVYTKMRSSPDMVWIQHSSPIQPGNSGGPLIDKQTMKVIGVNTWVNDLVKFGYAGSVRYLQTLMSTAKDELRPFPPEDPDGRFPSEAPEEDPGLPNPGIPGGPVLPPQMAQVLPVRDITAAKVTKQFEECDKLQWQPPNSASYRPYSELAKLLVTAKELSLNQGLLPAISGEERKAAIDAGEECFRKLAAVDWSGEKAANVSRLALSAIDLPGMGILAVAKRLPGQPPGRSNLVLLDLEGTPVIAEMPPDASSKVKDGRVLIVGQATPSMMRVQTPDQVLMIKIIRVNHAHALEQ